MSLNTKTDNLFEAVEDGDLEIVKYLVENGADVNADDYTSIIKYLEYVDNIRTSDGYVNNKTRINDRKFEALMRLYKLKSSRKIIGKLVNDNINDFISYIVTQKKNLMLLKYLVRGNLKIIGKHLDDFSVDIVELLDKLDAEDQDYVMHLLIIFDVTSPLIYRWADLSDRSKEHMTDYASRLIVRDNELRKVLDSVYKKKNWLQSNIKDWYDKQI